MSDVVELPRRVADKMIEHAREGKARGPEEICGLVVADEDGEVVDILPVKNAATDKRITYHMDPLEQHKAFMAMEYRGLDLYGIYHSHPETRAYPSETDRGLAFDPETDQALYPGVVYFIVSLADEPPVIRGFYLPDPEMVEEVTVAIVD